MNARLKLLDKHKDNLLASVTHDLKTPLNCIINYLKKAKISKNVDDINDLLDIVLRNAEL